MSEIALEPLDPDSPQLAILACWHHAQWRELHPGETLAQREAWLRADCGRGGIPTTVIACDGPLLLGSASLVAKDMDSHPELSPWLASVYVETSARRRGLGALLVRRIEEEARRAGVARLWLYTPDQEAFYARLGWERHARETYAGHEVVIMRRELRA